jgi:hypothetical protein
VQKGLGFWAVGHDQGPNATSPRREGAESHQGVTPIIAGSDHGHDLATGMEALHNLSGATACTLHQGGSGQVQLAGGVTVEGGRLLSGGRSH